MARILRDNVGPLPPSYIAGKTILRDAIMDHRGCSALRAERTVDRLEANGYVRFERNRAGRLWEEPTWRIGERGGALS